MTSVFSNLIEKLEKEKTLSSEEQKIFIEQISSCKNAVKVIHAYTVLLRSDTNVLFNLHGDISPIILNITDNIFKGLYSFEETGYYLMEELKEFKEFKEFKVGGKSIDTNKYKNIDWNDYN